MPRVAGLVLTALLLVVPSLSLAQIGGGGSIQGTVLDTSGAPVPGATVTATNAATGIQTVRQTTEAGMFALTPLQPGEYRVTVALDGFQTFARNGVIVDALSVVGLNATLQIGNITQEVVVTADAPPLATADARLGQTIRNEVYTALPLVMNTGGPRDPTAFMFIMPGVQSIGRWGNVMGGQDFTTDMYVEGIPITNAVVQGEGRNLSFGISVEAIDQFQVETSGTAVTFNGQGASNYVVKSGTNNFRGSAFEYFRNEALDARAYFSRVTPEDNQHEYGGTFGGPISRNRMFFFVAYDGYRDRRQTPSTLTSIPTLAQRNGDFSALPVTIYTRARRGRTRAAPGSSATHSPATGFRPIGYRRSRGRSSRICQIRRARGCRTTISAARSRRDSTTRASPRRSTSSQRAAAGVGAVLARKTQSVDRISRRHECADRAASALYGNAAC